MNIEMTVRSNKHWQTIRSRDWILIFQTCCLSDLGFEPFKLVYLSWLAFFMFRFMDLNSSDLLISQREDLNTYGLSWVSWGIGAALTYCGSAEGFGQLWLTVGQLRDLGTDCSSVHHVLHIHRLIHLLHPSHCWSRKSWIRSMLVLSILFEVYCFQSFFFKFTAFNYVCHRK